MKMDLGITTDTLLKAVVFTSNKIKVLRGRKMNELKTENDIKELIADYEYEDVIIFSHPDYASAFIGVSEDNRAVYDYDKMVKYLMDKDDMTDIEAIEFVEYNTIRSLPYFENAPIIIHNLASD